MTSTNAPENQVFEKDDIKVTLTQLPDCLVTLNIQMPSKEAKNSYKKAIKRINKEVSLPGFRKGKAPESVIIKHYEKYVDKEWKDLLTHSALQKGLEIADVFPLNPRRINPPKIEKCDLEIGATFAFSFEKEPHVESVDIQNLKVKAPKAPKVTKTQNQDYLKSLQVMDATWEDITDRGVKKGDFVVLDIDAIDQDPPKKICAGKRFEIAKGKIGQWLMDLIMDKKTGEELEATSELDESADKDTQENFQATLCKVTIKGIKKPTLPKVDEAFAKKLGLESVEELQEQIEKKLLADAEQEEDQKLVKTIKEELLKSYDFPLPQSMVEEERQQRLKEKVAELKKQELSKDEMLKQEKEIEKSIGKEVNESLKIWFISKAIAKEKKIHVSDEEISQAIIAQLSQFGGQGLDMKAFIQNENFRSRVYVDLLMHKVNDLLVKAVKEA